MSLPRHNSLQLSLTPPRATKKLEPIGKRVALAVSPEVCNSNVSVSRSSPDRSTKPTTRSSIHKLTKLQRRVSSPSTSPSIAAVTTECSNGGCDDCATSDVAYAHVHHKHRGKSDTVTSCEPCPCTRSRSSLARLTNFLRPSPALR
ncbi:hypothetical protein CONPUDRAFT_164532 [Coniophora puteana RWD-64-598 SS2]|uniref:Uncharacterized protein n=1 Tax=Coniophora puteana (strain RWD-64-598) TaxID=741705 RepID=A0A5M3MRG8_CONPW|nr:uncharacterized protein CONPUDRAFT_164532 [Coniophora puteana RWD-64-598 SS2]EIW81749.1 hypothetical protein CONPUDRAFT_164532 [Coniophora puteana RWD-64-598 SS2]